VKGSSQFPFSAVVGQDEVKLALMLAAVDPAIGGVLLRGEKGSAKTTLARGLAALLADDAPFVELPIGATEDRLVGTLDLAAALTAGERRFEPGLLAAADGGVLYVDEVNLLPDHLVDVLLDVAASGINRIEREGVSHTHPSRFVLVGSMNPEEGDLRPQLLDRFGLAVEVRAPADPVCRAEVVRRRLAFDADPGGFARGWVGADERLRDQLAGARPVRLAPELVDQVSRLCVAVHAEGMRADLTVCRGAAALAALEGRGEVSADDIGRVAPLALAHRRRRGPFDSAGIGADELERALESSRSKASGSAGPVDRLDSGELSSSAAGDSAAGEGGDPLASGDPYAAADRSAPSGPSDPGDPGASGDPGDPADPANPEPGGLTEERIALPDRPRPVVRLAATSGDPLSAPASGRRSTVEGPRGRLVADRPADGPVRSLAVGATVRAAAARRAGSDSAPPLLEADLRQAVREQRVGNLIVLAVDASGSMGSDRLMEAAKGAVLSLLLDAYQRRDRVALVTFRGDTAEVALTPTGSVEVARARLAELPTGGRTPLAAGIRTALDVASAPGRSEQLRPLLVLVTDGRATAAPEGDDPVAAAHDAALAVRQRGVSAVVVDAESGPTRLGLARELAQAMGAKYLTLPELSAGTLEAVVRSVSNAEHGSR
jgi:magnesium chelatase subunit D